MDGHGPRATDAGPPAARGRPAHCSVFVRPRVPGDPVAGATCSPGAGTSQPVQPGLGPARQKRADFSRRAGAGQEH